MLNSESQRISTRTVWKELKRLGLNSCVTWRKTLMEHNDWTQEQRRKVMWSRFTLPVWWAQWSKKRGWFVLILHLIMSDLRHMCFSRVSPSPRFNISLPRKVHFLIQEKLLGFFLPTRRHYIIWLYCHWLLTFWVKMIGCDRMFTRHEEVDKGEIHFNFNSVCIDHLETDTATEQGEKTSLHLFTFYLYSKMTPLSFSI